MKRIGMFRGMKLCADYKKMDAAQREAFRAGRLHEMVAWARANSPYYAKLYERLPEQITLHDLPPVTKRELMAHWDEWLATREVTLADVRAFMKNPDNIGRKLKGKYLVFTTSGSTGNPLIALCDTTANNVMGAINATRAYARAEDLRAFIRRGGKTVGVFATGGFYLSNSSVRSRLLAMPWKKRQMAVTSALLPVEEIVRQLNAFQPAMLGGYPSCLELLVDEVRAGRLHLSPVIVMTGGEYLADSLRARLAEAFDCYVQTSYACTEGGSVACECREKCFHLNDDWLIVEPVDSENRPVPDGVRADKILLTNLYNFTQPYIRYEVTDRVTMHREPCSCGNPSPWLELEGRTDDVVSFTASGREVKIAPLTIYAVLTEVRELRRFQLIVSHENRAELRLEPSKGISREAAFSKAEAVLLSFLAAQGISNVEISLSDAMPRQQPGSGKFKHIINAG